MLIAMREASRAPDSTGPAKPQTPGGAAIELPELVAAVKDGRRIIVLQDNVDSAALSGVTAPLVLAVARHRDTNKLSVKGRMKRRTRLPTLPAIPACPGLTLTLKGIR